jgi:hypothetical protein
MGIDPDVWLDIVKEGAGRRCAAFGPSCERAEEFLPVPARSSIGCEPACEIGV